MHARSRMSLKEGHIEVLAESEERIVESGGTACTSGDCIEYKGADRGRAPALIVAL